MKTSVYPVIMSNDIKEKSDFFMTLFDFRETFVSDWYISLESEGFELALIDVNHETIPDVYRKECQGIIINIEVDNVDNLYSSIVKNENMTLLSEIRSEDFGQRHFIVESPSKIMVDIIQVIPPSEEFLNNYIEGVNN